MKQFLPFRCLSPLAWQLVLSAFVLCICMGSAHAQINVNLEIKRRVFIVNEPVIANVTIQNNTGHDIMLADTQEGGQWFSFQIVTNEGRLVAPRNPNYELQPLPMKAGEAVKRTVNLTELYEIGDFGGYHITASIFFPSIGKYFASKRDNIEITEGHLVWKQTVGVPNSPETLGAYRTFSLLTLEHDRGKMLYVRVVGQDDGTIYGCYNLGRILDGFPPDAKFDSGNNLAVLQTLGQREYLFSRIGIDGNFIGQTSYSSIKAQPFLRKLENGTLQLVGAVRKPVNEQVAGENVPKLSDRPVGFPK